MSDEYKEMRIDGIDDSMEISKPTIHYLDIGEAFKNQQLFQDAEGKIPVTEAGQAIGLIHYSDGSVFLKEQNVSERPTLRKDKNGYFITREEGRWV